jgi:hypothetical protein
MAMKMPLLLFLAFHNLLIGNIHIEAFSLRPPSPVNTLSTFTSNYSGTTRHKHDHEHVPFPVNFNTNYPNANANVNTRTQRQRQKMMMSPIPIDFPTDLESITTTATTILSSSSSSISSSSSFLTQLSTMTREQAEELAGPFFGASLFPYLAFLYFLDVPQNNTPKGVTIGFATCLLFVFLTIPAAIAAQVLYGVSLADSDWLHGSAESLLTITNLVTVVAFRQALKGKEEEAKLKLELGANSNTIASTEIQNTMPISATSYQPMIVLVGILTFIAGITAFVPAISNPEIHTPYLNGFMDLPKDWVSPLFGRDEPDNALTVGW